MQEYPYIRSYILLSVIIFSSLSISEHDEQVVIKNLNQDWTYQILNLQDQVQKTAQIQNLLGKEFNTQIPTNLHLDLMRDNRISNIYEGNNLKKYEWISYCSVKYTKRFQIQPTYKNKAFELILNGIDTFSKIYLNGKQILQTKNMFRQYIIKINPILQNKGQNVLEILIQPSQKYSSTNSVNISSYVKTRRPAYQYLKNLSPQLKTVGIWRPVQLRIYDHIRFDYIWIRNRQLSKQKAVLNFAVKFQLNLPVETLIPNNLFKVKIFYNNRIYGQKYIREDVAYINIQIQNPSFWWPNGFGQPFVYDFQVVLFKKQSKIDQKNLAYGIRTLNLKAQDDQHRLIINDYNIEVKGAYFLPPDILPTSQKKYNIQNILSDITESNLNAIRIWGGGLYLTEQFLQIASRKGIMILYEFMFSQTNLDITPEFLHDVQQELKHQIRLARNYPALTLWIGDNKILLDKKSNLSENRQKIEETYQIIFQKLVSRIVEIQNYQVPFVSLNPRFYQNITNSIQDSIEPKQVDQKQAQKYQRQVNSFISKFVYPSFPVTHSLQKFKTDDFPSLSSSSQLRYHQTYKSTLIINLILKLNKLDNVDKKTQIYVTQILQARALQFLIIKQRTYRKKPLEILFWQLNDFWPTISSSSIDYYGYWKAMQYVVKRSFTNIAVFVSRDASVTAINSNFYEVDIKIVLSMVLFNGTTLQNKTRMLKLEQNSIKQLQAINWQKYNQVKEQIVSYCEIYQNNQLQMRNTQFHPNHKQLKLQKAKLSVKYNSQSNKIIIKSNKFVKDLFIDYQDFYVHFSDNYFDIIPNVEVQISIITKNSDFEVKKLNFLSFRQVNQNNEPIQVQFF